MSFQMVRGNIVQMRVDAIVNAANSSLLGGGGVDGAIHRAAGPGLLAECRTLGGCAAGEAKVTKGYDLPARYVIHTVGPVWHGGTQGEEATLRSCYRTSLERAVELGCESVAFPLISSGAYGYPFAEAARVASDEILLFLQTRELEVTLVLFEARDFLASGELYGRVGEYIDGRGPGRGGLGVAMPPICAYRVMPSAEIADDESPAPCRESVAETPKRRGASSKEWDTMQKLSACRAELEGLQARLKTLDVGFSQFLLKRIQASGMGEVECYTRANVDRRHFSKIRSQANYVPSKQTVCAFAIALRMDIPETEELLRRAGYSLSPSLTFDLIIRFAIENGIYDVHLVNRVLFDYDQKLLGNSPV